MERHVDDWRLYVDRVALSDPIAYRKACLCNPRLPRVGLDQDVVKQLLRQKPFDASGRAVQFGAWPEDCLT